MLPRTMRVAPAVSASFLMTDLQNGQQDAAVPSNVSLPLVARNRFMTEAEGGLVAWQYPFEAGQWEGNPVRFSLHRWVLCNRYRVVSIRRAAQSWQPLRAARADRSWGLRSGTRWGCRRNTCRATGSLSTTASSTASTQALPRTPSAAAWPPGGSPT